MNIKRIALLSVAMTGLFSTMNRAMEVRPAVTVTINNHSGRTYKYGLMTPGYRGYTWDPQYIAPGENALARISHSSKQGYNYLNIERPDGTSKKIRPTGDTTTLTIDIQEDGTINIAGSAQVASRF